MYEIVYSPVVQEKIEKIKMKLVNMCGEKKGLERLLKVIDGFEVRLTFSNTGIPIKALYDVEPEYEKYYVIFLYKNYFLYYIDGNKVNVMEMYDEKEDYARQMFGIITTTQETLDYWKE